MAATNGYHLDPSDFSTMWQDSAGTVPVTAVGQPVGRILDKSGNGNHFTQPTSAARPLLQIDSGGRHFLLFDGVDDVLVSGSFAPGSDKVQAFVGMRKLSDAVSAVPLAHGSNALAGGASSPAQTGAWAIRAPLNTASANYTFSAQGTTRSTASSGSIPAPVTSVVSVTADIASSQSSLLVNDLVQATSTASMGTGNFNAYVASVGGLANSTNFGNYRIYQAVARYGPNLSAAEITAINDFVNSKTGAY
ncbi:MAG: hypothetical protein ACK4IS_13395 [Erythrobacter sp.]